MDESWCKKKKKSHTSKPYCKKNMELLHRLKKFLRSSPYFLDEWLPLAGYLLENGIVFFKLVRTGGGGVRLQFPVTLSAALLSALVSSNRHRGTLKFQLLVPIGSFSGNRSATVLLILFNMWCSCDDRFAQFSGIYAHVWLIVLLLVDSSADYCITDKDTWIALCTRHKLYTYNLYGYTHRGKTHNTGPVESLGCNRAKVDCA